MAWHGSTFETRDNIAASSFGDLLDVYLITHVVHSGTVLYVAYEGNRMYKDIVVDKGMTE